MKRITVYAYDDAGRRTVDGWFNLDAATRIEERVDWNNGNQVSVHVTDTGDRYAAREHQTLFRTADRRWVLHRANQWQHIPDRWMWLDDEQAKKWLVVNGGSDDELEEYFGKVEEERGPGRPPTIPDPVAVHVHYPRELLAAVDAAASEAGVSRAEWLRRIAASAVQPATAHT
jgi:hypothetical protein